MTEILRLQGRNMAGFWDNAFISEKAINNMGDAGGVPLLINLVILILMPVMILIFPLFKTIFDVFTRKEIPKQALNVLIAKIDTLDDQKTEQLVAEISNYKGKSNLTKALLADLENKPNEIRDTLLKTVSLDVDTHKKELLDTNASNTIEANKESVQEITRLVTLLRKEEIFATSSINVDRVLVAGDQAVLDFLKRKGENEANIPDEKTKIVKSLLRTYLEDDRNNGKKMEHVILDAVEKITKPRI